MSNKTANYNFHKIALSDSPPDITAFNNNFDILDEKLKEIEEGNGASINGADIEKGTIPLDRLEELPECSVTSNVPMHLSVTSSGGLRITYNDGK